MRIYIYIYIYIHMYISACIHIIYTYISYLDVYAYIQATKMIAYARDGQFIDTSTESVTVEVVTFNAELNRKCVYVCVCM